MIETRPARPDDVPVIHRMIVDLAAFEREADSVVATEAMLAERLFAPHPAVWATLAAAEGAVVGMAIWFLNFSTWTGHHGLYLEDLFVAPAGRRRGVAGALFGALVEEARTRDCARIDWQVLDWNADAKAFYRSLGAHEVTGWERWRLEVGRAPVRAAADAAQGRPLNFPARSR